MDRMGNKIRDRKMNRKNIFALIISLASFSVFATTELETEKQKLSYTMGTYFAMSITQQNIQLDVDVFIQAVEDVLKENELQIDVQEMQDILTKYKEVTEKQQSDAVTNNQKLGAAFLAENKKKEDIMETASGLQYKVIKKGDGVKPVAGADVTVHYKGTLIDGTVFDSSYARGEPATFSLSQVIEGWQEVVPMMATGSKWQIFIPSALAYGDRAGSELIAPGSTLIFDIELISINE